MAPFERINLTNQKWTGPLKGSDGKILEIKRPKLDTYEHPDWFYADNEGVHFIARCDGDTTSGSGYPRSELREMKAGGLKEAKWSSTSGTHIIKARMKIVEAPVKKPQVVCMQVHGGNDDVTVMMYDGFKKALRWKKGDTLQSSLLIPDYLLNTWFEPEMRVAKGYFEHWINGVRKARFYQAISTCYFKVGDYTQSNVLKGDKPEARGHVVISNLEISHAA
jgi:hypothetical protein